MFIFKCVSKDKYFQLYSWIKKIKKKEKENIRTSINCVLWCINIDMKWKGGGIKRILVEVFEIIRAIQLFLKCFYGWFLVGLGSG